MIGGNPSPAIEPGANVVPVKDAELLVAGVVRGLLMHGTMAQRIRGVFEAVAPLFGEGVEFQIYLGIRLDRDPAPLLLDRIWFGEVYDRIEPRPLSEIQRLIDASCESIRWRVPRARLHRGTPMTAIVSEMFSQEYFRSSVQPALLSPLGFVDCVTSDCVSSDDRLITLHVLRKQAPLTPYHCQLTSMLMRALVPVVDRHMEERAPGSLSRLSLSQVRLLRRLLRNQPEAEDARRMPQLLAFFDADSREALAARFCDAQTLLELDELERVIVAEG